MIDNSSNAYPSNNNNTHSSHQANLQQSSLQQNSFAHSQMASNFGKHRTHGQFAVPAPSKSLFRLLLTHPFPVEEQFEYKPSSTVDANVLQTDVKFPHKIEQHHHHSQPSAPVYAKGPSDSVEKDQQSQQAMKLSTVLS